MLKRILLIAVIVLLSVQIGYAQGRGLGVGLILGEPTGISVKGWVTNSGAIEVAIGYPSLSYSYGTAISADYVWHSHIFRSHEYFPLYYGIGGIFGVSSGLDIMGARGVFGIAWWPHHSSLDIFLQVQPTLYFKPASHFEFDYGLGIRIFF
jgi:hypothetical protein